MKALTKLILQKLFGFERYLFIFAWFMVYKLKWDKKEKDFMYFLSMIQDGGIILDIGANIGVMTTLLAKKFRNSEIISFEPIPHNINTTKKIIKNFGLTNVKLLEIALGDKNGKVEMVLPKVDNVKMHGLSHVVDETITEFNEGDTFEVDITKLDDLEELSNSPKTIHAIKIDVENFEYFVFKGGQQLIEKNKPIIYCELWDNENREKCFNIMLEMGYSIKILHKNELTEFDQKIHTSQNFFFVAEKKQA